MQKIKVLVLSYLANPTCTNWIQGLEVLNYSVAVLDCKPVPASQDEIESWGFKGSKIPIFQMWKDFPTELSQKVEHVLSGKPDIIFVWEGAAILQHLWGVKKSFPEAKVIHCVNTYPNAITELTELRMHWRYREASLLTDAYIFYSEVMQALFSKNVPAARHKPYLAIVEPFFEKAYADSITDPAVPRLNRVDEHPHVIFTGRGSELWRSFSFSHRRRDALGPFFKQLANRNIHVYLPTQAELKDIPNFHHYPNFSNDDLFEGRFAQYLSQFDAHLVMYNEYNGIMRRWTSACLSTRFASAMTSTTPLAVTKTSQFVKEYWQDTPFGFTFSGPEDLAQSLRDRQLLASLRHNMKQVHHSYSFEAQSQRLSQFFSGVLEKSKLLSAMRHHP
jgi:hypothetical protein